MARTFYRSGIMALSVIGVYALWRNRFQVQRFLESRGISLPILSTVREGSVMDTVRSGVSKAVGQTQYLGRRASESVSDTMNDIQEGSERRTV